MNNHQWANTILEATKDHEVIAVLDAVNRLTHTHKANRGAVIVACAQMLAQTIVAADPDVAREVREGIMTLIDDYAIRLAVDAP